MNVQNDVNSYDTWNTNSPLSFVNSRCIHLILGHDVKLIVIKYTESMQCIRCLIHSLCGNKYIILINDIFLKTFTDANTLKASRKYDTPIIKYHPQYPVTTYSARLVFTDVPDEPTASIYSLQSAMSNDISPNLTITGPCIVIYMQYFSNLRNSASCWLLL